MCSIYISEKHVTTEKRIIVIYKVLRKGNKENIKFCTFPTHTKIDNFGVFVDKGEF